MQAPPLIDVYPSAQEVHPFEAGTVDVFPAAQSEQLVARLPEYVPVPQGLQVCAAELAANFPAVQSLHSSAPASSVDVPGSQL